MGKTCSTSQRDAKGGLSKKDRRNAKNAAKNAKKGADNISGMIYSQTLETEVTEKTQQNEEFVQAYKFLVDDDGLGADGIEKDLNKFFRKQIFKAGVGDYITQEGSMYLSYEMLMTILQAQIATLDSLLPTIGGEDGPGGNSERDKYSILGDPGNDPKAQMNNLFGSKVSQINRPYCLKKKAGGIVPVEGAQEGEGEEAGKGEEGNEGVLGQGHIVYHLSDLECIYIHICITELDKNENAPSQIEFPNVKVDLKKNTGFMLSHPQEELELVVADPDDPQRLAPQPENGDSIEFDISPYLKQDGIFDLQAGLFCETWAFQRYGSTVALPTLREILDGLKLFFQQFIDDHMKESKT